MTAPVCPHLSGEAVCSICAELASARERIRHLEADLAQVLGPLPRFDP